MPVFAVWRGYGLQHAVERPDQVAALTSLGCDSAQGFHWTAALPADELERRLHAKRPAPLSGVNA